ncbi:hypothetical protein ACJIZ3_012774 [Penstemon smallii]|uniref:Stigma-specific Stig1 family protein n=1 Tax=Penstemon smallii TaxID=265156 RepID=A0ABD3UN13_9LAMI
MKYLKFIFLLTTIMSLAINSLLVESNYELYNNDEDMHYPETAEPTSLRGVSRFFPQRARFAFSTCNRYPRVCRVKGSPGPDCCKRGCVNVGKDRLNCGKCGHKCKYSEFCCKGKCINPFTDKKHCGGCNSKCKKGSTCMYGMCSYA